MSSKFYPILDQVDGIKDTFSLPEAFVVGSAVLAYNGQVYDRGQNIIAEDPTGDPATVQLSFVPSVDTHALMIIYKSLEELPDKGVRGFTYPPGGLLNDF